MFFAFPLSLSTFDFRQQKLLPSIFLAKYLQNYTVKCQIPFTSCMRGPQPTPWSWSWSKPLKCSRRSDREVEPYLCNCPASVILSKTTRPH